MILQIFTLIGALGMFLYGMNLMSSGLQKAAGKPPEKCNYGPYYHLDYPVVECNYGYGRRFC